MSHHSIHMSSLAKSCRPNQERNPFTKRCNKTCKSGYSRNVSFKCRKDKKVSKETYLNLCAGNKILNPKTNRCIKKKTSRTKSKRTIQKASDFFKNPFDLSQ